MGQGWCPIYPSMRSLGVPLWWEEEPLWSGGMDKKEDGQIKDCKGPRGRWAFVPSAPQRAHVRKERLSVLSANCPAIYCPWVSISREWTKCQRTAHSYTETLPHSVMALVGGAFGRWLGLDEVMRVESPCRGLEPSCGSQDCLLSPYTVCHVRIRREDSSLWPTRKTASRDLAVQTPQSWTSSS